MDFFNKKFVCLVKIKQGVLKSVIFISRKKFRTSWFAACMGVCSVRLSQYLLYVHGTHKNNFEL